MKNHTLFSSKDKSKKLKCRLLQFLFGGVSVNTHNIGIYPKAMRKSTRLPYFYPPPQSRLTNMSFVRC